MDWIEIKGSSNVHSARYDEGELHVKFQKNGEVTGQGFYSGVSPEDAADFLATAPEGESTGRALQKFKADSEKYPWTRQEK